MKTPNKQRKPNSDERSTSKKEIVRSSMKSQESEESDQEEKVVRVADYEMEAKPNRKETKNVKSSQIRDRRDSGSKILMRRSNSKLNKSG